MSRIYAPNEEHHYTPGEVDFIHGAAAVAADADTSWYEDNGYIIDNSKHALNLLDELTPEQLRDVCAYLQIAIDQGEEPDSKHALVRAIEAEISGKYLAEVVVTSAAGSLKAGTLVVNVASALLDGGDKDVEVAVDGSDATVGDVASAIRAALAADVEIAELFTVGGEAANIVLTAKLKAASDNTLAITLADADGTGIILGASGNTTGGTAPVPQSESVTVTTGSDKGATLVVTVTSALLATGSKAYNVPVTDADDSAAEVAEAIYNVLIADSALTDNFELVREGAKLTLTARVAAANDGSLGWALTSADTSTVAFGVSTAEAVGVAGVAQVETVAVTGVAGVAKSAIGITGAGLYKYTVGDDAAAPLYGDDVNDWEDIETGDEIGGELAGKTITVARVNAGGYVRGLGSAVISIV